MDLANERAVGLEEEEKLKMQLVEPLTKLQLLEDIKEESGSDSSGGGNTRTQQHIHSLSQVRTTRERNSTAQ